MTRAEIRNQAVRLYPKCAGLFELPLMVYTQIVADNLTRSKPYRLSVRLDSKLLKTLHPDVYAECSSKTTYKRFSVV